MPKHAANNFIQILSASRIDAFQRLPTLNMMRRFFRRIFRTLQRDDLFVRVTCLLSGTLFGGLGIALAGFVASEIPHLTLAWLVFLGAVAIALSALGGLLIARCFVQAQSRIARLVGDGPDAAGLEEAVFLLLIILLPAALLTLFLRRLGLRGSPWPYATQSGSNSRRKGDTPTFK